MHHACVCWRVGVPCCQPPPLARDSPPPQIRHPPVTPHLQQPTNTPPPPHTHTLTHRQRKPRDRAASHEPSRTSGRLREREMLARGEVPPDVERGSELAQFIINGECPR
jgi:hypothetical protein